MCKPLATTHYNYGTLGELHSVVTPEVTIEYLHNAHNQLSFIKKRFLK